MTDPLGSISGLTSGIQWRDLVERISALDKQRRLDPVTARQSLAKSRVEAWGKFQTLVTTFRDAARALKEPSTFAAFGVTGGTSPTSGRTLLTATAAAGANPGTHTVEVIGLARANKLSGAVVASQSTALGLTGEFSVNGRKVTLIASDTLASVRDKIAALNSGSNASGVSASILSTGATQHRLVLTSDTTGAKGVELTDDASGTLQTLGLVDATKTLNVDSSGGAQSYRVSSATAAIATMLGVSWPPPSSIEIGGRVIAVDLTVDSLSTIAARIAAAGGNATVLSETVNGKSEHRLVTSDTVSASTPDGVRTLEVLGFLKSGRSGIAQVVTSENTYNDAGGLAATGTTLLTDLHVGTNALGLVAGDTLTIGGKRGDGTIVSSTLTIGASDTLQTLVNKLNDASTGFGTPSRAAAASIVGGKLVLADATAGDSQLALSITATRALDGSTVPLGRQLTSTVGRLREVVQGADALAKVDGVVVQRRSNTIADAVAGLTLNLQAAEAGTATALTVSRDRDAIAGKIDEVVKAYNALHAFRTEQTKEKAALRGNATLRGSIGTITENLLTDVSGLLGNLKRAGNAGLTLQADGTLKLDKDVLSKGIDASYADVVNLFATGGASTNGSLSYFLSTTKTKPGSYAVNVTTAATTASATGAAFSGTYADDGVADTLTITDSTSGATGNISLANGDTIDTIVTKLNTLFATNKMALVASKSANNLVLSAQRYGSAATFTVGYTAGGTDSTSQLGIAAGVFAGTDIAGTIGGHPATGAGQVLTASAGQNPEGLALTYTGTATGAVGSINFTLGVGGMLGNAAERILDPVGAVEGQLDSLDTSITNLQRRADTLTQSIERRRQALVTQFVEMERTLSRIQQQGTALTNFIASFQRNNR